MGKYLLSAQAPFTLIAPSPRFGTDPVRWQTFTQQFFTEIPGRGPHTVGNPGAPGTWTGIGLLDGNRTASGGAIEVISNTFLGPTTLRLGKYSLTSGVDFAIGGSANATAVNLHAAIAALPEFAASTVAAPVVTVDGPIGPGGDRLLFHAEGVSAGNLELTPPMAHLAGSSPVVGPPTLG